MDTKRHLKRGELIENHLEILFLVSQVLSRAFHPSETLKQVLGLLHEVGGYHFCFVTLDTGQSGECHLSIAHKEIPVPAENITYKPGEGVIGHILQTGETVLLPRVKDEGKFLDRLKVFDPELPFIGAPILGHEGKPIGALAAQPPEDRAMLGERTRFLEMIANLVSQTVRLFEDVETQKREIQDERDSLRRSVKKQHGFKNIVGRSNVMKAVFEQIRLVAKWNTTVLVRGESGTGKELIANAIHYNSPRSSAPFIKLNCAAIPDNLLESELFGHEKGAFTGAVGMRKGRFELADGGTIFLDEIGEISGAFQAKLLRVLQEGEFERIGGTQTLKVDVRVIAATNRDLEEGVEIGEFREDLYYRLNVMPITLPALRERLTDVADLSRFLVDKISRLQGRELSISEDAVRQLQRHNWPGNVRELENCLERCAIMTEGKVIEKDVIDMMGFKDRGSFKPSAPQSSAARVEMVEDGIEDIDLNDDSISERDKVIWALEKAGWVQAKAARLLNMTPRQIAYRIQTLDIKVQQF
ncbi:MAG: nif-specific transcriptional activator NifA [Methylocystaceae bacterium]|nr:nif-specific transcriptional activator NifA [Methylocystaceae bacterium]